MTRCYLVVIDDSPEANGALRYATRRAAATGGKVEVLAISSPPDFVQWGGVQAAIEEEERLRIGAGIAATLADMGDRVAAPDIQLRSGEPFKVVRDYIGERDDIAALVLGAAATGDPGPMVNHFSGTDSGRLPCPVFIVPGGLPHDRIDQLS